MASSHASTSLPIHTSFASSRPAPLPISLKYITSHDQVLVTWSKAIDLFNSSLTKDESKKIQLAQFRRAEFEDLLTAANIAKKKVEQRRFSWTGNLQNVFRHINRYAGIGDIIVQHHAEYTSLVWGAFRFLLLFAVEEHKSSEELSKALEKIIQIVFRAEEYAKLFSTPSSSSTDRVFQSLHENLVRLFAEILNFLIRTTRFFEKRTLDRFVSAGVSPFNTKFQGIMRQIEDYEREVDKDKSLLESEGRKLQQEYDNGVWLRHADFKTDLRRLQQLHISGTCQWLLQNPSYLRWRDVSSKLNASDFMWIQGKPGCGKSVLASQIIRDLHSLGGSVVLYIFCKNGDENKNTLKSVLRNLIFEILEFSPQQAFHRLLLNTRLSEKSQCAQSEEVLWNILTQMIKEVNFIHCVIDGLDECQSSTPERVSFLSRLVEIFKQTPRAKLILISQLHLSESAEHSSLWIDIFIQPSNVQDDIGLLALTRMEESKKLCAHRQKDSLLEQLVARSNGMILWAELMIKELELGHWNIQSVLQRPPEGLFEMWQSILQRILNSRLITKKISDALQLVLAAAQPLSHEELALGLAVAHGLCDHEDYDMREDAMTEGRLIVQESSPLLMSMPDNTVQLTHTSLREYLFSQDLPSVQKFFGFNEQDAHDRMSIVLITYMSFQIFQAALTNQLQPKYFLLEYATRWLVYHTTRTGISTQVSKRLLAFFDIIQGWKWLQRLSDAYDVSFGHLQLLQLELATWAQSSCFDEETINTFSNVLLILAQKRYEAMRSLPNDDHLLLKSMQNLALIFSHQKQWKKAEGMHLKVLKIFERVLGAEHPNTLKTLSNLAIVYNGQGRYEESEKLFMQILETSPMVLGAESLDVMHSLAMTFDNQGRYKESESLSLQILAIRSRTLGAEHPDTLMSMHNLAATFALQKRFNEAEKLYGQVLETRIKVLGSEHPDTLMSMQNLAYTFTHQQRLKEAEHIQVRAAGIEKKLLGAEHSNTLTSMRNLAWTYHKQGRYKESEELGEEILEKSKRVLGEEHPLTLCSMHNLAATFRGQKRLKEAEEIQVQVLEIQKRVLGPEHPETMCSTHNLAGIYDSQGRYKESEKVNKQIMETRTKLLGAEHPDTLLTMHNLAQVIFHQDRVKEAEEIQVQVLGTQKRALGAEDPTTLLNMQNLAGIFTSQGRFDESEKLYMQVIETSKRVLGPEHPQLLASMQNLAWTIASQKRFKEAEELLVQVLEMRKKVLGVEHPDTLMSMQSLASLLGSQDRLREAEEIQVQATETSSKVLGLDHPDTLLSMHRLACTFQDQRRYEESAKLSKQILETRKTVLGAEHPTTLTTMLDLAETFSRQERLKEAEGIYMQVLGARTRVLGADHPDTRICMQFLAVTYMSQGRYDEGTQLMAKAVEMLSEVLGSDHPATAFAKSRLNEWLRKRSR